MDERFHMLHDTYQRNLLDIQHLNNSRIDVLLNRAAAFQAGEQASLDATPGVLLLFYEPSTRTRTSFHRACDALGLPVYNVDQQTSSLTKGETLADTARNAMALGAPVIVLRHPVSGRPVQLARQVPQAAVINAGDGWHEHPTQALLDLLTLRQQLGHDLTGLRITITGDILHSRVARSNTWMWLKHGIEVTWCGPRRFLPDTLPAEWNRVRVTSSLQEALSGADVVYALRVQKERLGSDEQLDAARYHQHFGLTQQRLGTRWLMHPGPVNRGVEVTSEVLDGPQSLVLSQAGNGPAVRQAVLEDVIRRWSTSDPASPPDRLDTAPTPAKVNIRQQPAVCYQDVQFFAPGRDKQRVNITVASGRLLAIEPANQPVRSDAGRVDGRHLVAGPGLFDPHVHLRDPGQTHKEDLQSGSASAARGGFTDIACMPNTQPVLDSARLVKNVRRRGSKMVSAVHVIAAITRGSLGQELADLEALAQAGAIGFSDDGHPVVRASLVRQALELSRSLNRPVIEHCEEEDLAAGGVMAAGGPAALLGLPGQPASAETTIVARDLELARETGGHLHLAHISCAASVELIRAAKASGVRVTAEVTPHHLVLTAQDLAEAGYDTRFKVNPPLRERADCEALWQGLEDGTIDFVATDHAPHHQDEKQQDFLAAPFGMTGLETALPLLVTYGIGPGHLDWHQLFDLLSNRARQVFDLGINLDINKPATSDLVIIDPHTSSVVDPHLQASKAANTPFAGQQLQGRIVLTVRGGQVTWQESTGERPQQQTARRSSRAQEVH